jgi:hypothetical protein
LLLRLALLVGAQANRDQNRIGIDGDNVMIVVNMVLHGGASSRSVSSSSQAKKARTTASTPCELFIYSFYLCIVHDLYPQFCRAARWSMSHG